MPPVLRVSGLGVGQKSTLDRTAPSRYDRSRPGQLPQQPQGVLLERRVENHLDAVQECWRLVWAQNFVQDPGKAERPLL